MPHHYFDYAKAKELRTAWIQELEQGRSVCREGWDEGNLKG